MSIRMRLQRRRDRFVGLCLALCTVWAVTASAESPIWLERVQTRWANTGELESWIVSAVNGGPSELIEAGEPLLSIGIFVDQQDLSRAMAWHQLPPGPGQIAVFVGEHAERGIEVRREYRPGAERGSVVHELRVTANDGNLPEDVRVELRLRDALRKHAPMDGSLGDTFYGYTRWLVAAGADAAFTAVREPTEGTDVAIVVRHRALVATTESGTWSIDPEAGATLTLDRSDLGATSRVNLGALELERSALAGTRYLELMYSDMWGPLRQLARLIEWIIAALMGWVGNAGVVMVLFAFLLRAALMPLGLWSIRQQRHFADVQRQMKPKIEHINKTMKGAKKSEAILATYKEHGVSPFTGLKGSTGLFVQLPILIALFAVTTESALFRDAHFLWLQDMSLPDRLVALPFSIPMLGAWVNVLPILLGAVCVAAALIQSRSAAGSSPRSGLILALIFVIFFYSCAAALVLYWLLVNVSQIFEGIYVARTRRTA